MFHRNLNSRQRLVGAACVLALVFCVSTPLVAQPIVDRGGEATASLAWVERLVLNLADRLSHAFGLDLDRAPGDAQQRHHLTIEPGGDAVPPPPEEGGTPTGPTSG